MKALIEGADGSDLRRYVNLILKEMNPSAPPPIVKFTDIKKRQFNLHLERMLSAAENGLAANMKAIEDYEPEVKKSWDMDPESRESQEIFQKAILLRYEYAHTFYTTYKALREIIQRAKDYGLSSSLAKERIEPWIHAQLKPYMPQFADWEWNYASAYPLLKHRMAVLLGESVRLNQQREDLGKLGNLTYDNVRNSFYEVIDLDLSQFPKQFVDGLTVLKYETWSDLMFWHLAMGDSRSLDEAARMWEDYISRGPDPLNHRDSSRNQVLGNLHILGSRIYAAREESSKSNALLVELKRSENFFATNARLWMTYNGIKKAGQSSGWAALPTPEDPNISLTLAKELLRNARQQTDRTVANSMRLDATVTLRNGILGLPNINDPEFLTIAPQLYQYYAYALYDSGLFYEAIVVAEQGLNRFKPLWERSRNRGGNPWLQGEELNAGGKMVQRLASNLFSYSQGLRGRAKNSASRDAYARAIDFLRLFDPERAKDGLDWNAYIVAREANEFEDALDALDRFAENNPTETLKVMGARAQTYYAWYEFERQRGGSNLDRLKKQMDEALAGVRAEVEPYIAKTKPIPEGQEKEVEKLWRFMTTVNVATLFSAEDYPAVLEKLDAEFWGSLQEDRDLNRQLFGYLSGSAYKIGAGIGRDPEKRKDPNLMVEMWPQYQNAITVYQQLIERWPELEERFYGNRRQLAALMNVVKSQANWFQQNVRAKTKGFENFDRSFFANMAKDAETGFAQIYPITEDTKESVILSIAIAHRNQGNIKAAVSLFERYKEALSEDATLQAFRQDPSKLMVEIGNKMSSRQSLKPFWERKGDQSIPDLLVDDPGFDDIISNPNIDPKDWPEKKRDFVGAMNRVKAFGKALRSQKNLIRGFDELYKEYEAFSDLVQGLAYSVQIDSWLVDDYQKLGRFDDAMQLVGDLYEYDPLNPSFMALVIESTLQALKAGKNVPPEKVKEAQGIAARLRNLSATSTRRDLYWISSIQVMEFAFFQGDTDSINRILQQHIVDNNIPPADFSVPLSNPWEAKDQQAVDICSRYLELFALKGVTQAKPYRIEERDGKVLFIREKK